MMFSFFLKKFKLKKTLTRKYFKLLDSKRLLLLSAFTIFYLSDDDYSHGKARSQLDSK